MERKEKRVDLLKEGIRRVDLMRIYILSYLISSGEWELIHLMKD